jgi:hypothetical protein
MKINDRFTSKKFFNIKKRTLHFSYSSMYGLEGLKEGGGGGSGGGEFYRLIKSMEG